MHDLLLKTYGDAKVRHPSTLIELSNTELKRHTKNTIHLSGLIEHQLASMNNKSLPLYSKVTYGSNINKRKRRVSFVDTSFVNYVDLKKTRKNYIMITANKDEYLNQFKDVFFFDTCMSTIMEYESKARKYQSGVVLLMVAAIPRMKRDYSVPVLFNNNLYKQVKKCKPDIKKSFDHYGSTGEVYAFGNKPNYKICDQSSIGEYVNKTSKILKTRVRIDESSNIINEQCAEVVCDGMGILEKIIPPIKLLVSPILTAASKVQIKYKDVLIKDVKTTPSGFWNTMLNVNGATTQFHAELDCSYTLITVPRQAFCFKKCIDKLPTFLFQMSISHHAMLDLNEDVSIVYNGQFLVHRQNFNREDKSEENFYNISCYGNNKLFNHLRKSLCRLNENT